METLEKEIEEKIKNRLSHIKPSRDLFESTMRSVTQEEVNRSNKEEASRLSLYQLIKNILIKKNLLVGVPIVIVAIIAIIFLTKTPKIETIANNVVPQENGTTGPQMAEDTSSIDSIVASFNKEADAEAAIAGSGNEDIAPLTAELQDYNNIKNYENIF